MKEYKEHINRLSRLAKLLEKLYPHVSKILNLNDDGTFWLIKIDNHAKKMIKILHLMQNILFGLHKIDPESAQEYNIGEVHLLLNCLELTEHAYKGINRYVLLHLTIIIEKVKVLEKSFSLIDNNDSDLVNLRFPAKEDFGRMSLADLYLIWLRNHMILYNHFISVDLPYFGLSGRPHSHIEKIMEERKGQINIGTFYEKEKSEFRLLQLYNLGVYIFKYIWSSIGLPADARAGGILIVNVEKDGQNITKKWEKLHASPFFATNLPFDTPKLKSLFSSLTASDNLLWRSDLTLLASGASNPASLGFDFSFDHTVIGVIDCRELYEKYQTKLNADLSEVHMDVLQYIRFRLLAQEILSNVFKLIANHSARQL